MAEKKEIRVSLDPKVVAYIAKYADKNELGVGEAVERLLTTAISRLSALDRYAKNKKAEAKAGAKPKKAGKKAKPKKAAAAANGAAAHA